MYVFRSALFVTLGLFLTACGGTDDTTSPSTTQSSTQAIDAGEDKHIKVNESVTLKIKKVPNLENVSSYAWSHNGNILATTRSFSYVPTNVGVDVLKSSVLYSDGTTLSDTLKVIVTNQEINMNIPKISDSLKAKYLKAVNDVRAQSQDCGEEGLFSATTKMTWNDKLYKAGYEHMQDLIASETFEHEGSGTESDWTGYTLGKKSNFIERIENYDYKWSRLGENLGGGTSISEVEEMVQGWLESDHHCANLMNPDFTEVGVVMIKDEDAKYTHYWGQELGRAK